jgi:hypothetical protein
VLGGRDTAKRSPLCLAGIAAAVGLGASAARHVGWWLEWQLRAHPGEGCRELQEELPLPSVLSAETAA